MCDALASGWDYDSERIEHFPCFYSVRSTGEEAGSKTYNHRINNSREKSHKKKHNMEWKYIPGSLNLAHHGRVVREIHSVKSVPCAE